MLGPLEMFDDRLALIDCASMERVDWERPLESDAVELLVPSFVVAIGSDI